VYKVKCRKLILTLALGASFVVSAVELPALATSKKEVKKVVTPTTQLSVEQQQKKLRKMMIIPCTPFPRCAD
jgi:hypothetical protein